MKAFSINILDRIKMFIQFNNLTSKPERTIHNEQKSVEQFRRGQPKSNEESDLAVFQRKAYMGHFMAGPIALINPGLFK